MTEQEQTMTKDAADRVLRQEYWDAVRDYATELEDAVKSGEIESEDELNERIHETVDGSSWIIYTRNNFQVLTYCKNSDAYTDEYGEAPTGDGGALNWAALAYAAMLEDVREATESFDNLKPDEDEEEDDEDAEDE